MNVVIKPVVLSVIASEARQSITANMDCHASLAKIGRHTSELQSHHDLVCRLLLEKKKKNLFSGVLPLTDMFLYMYSIVDLLSTPMPEKESRYHDLISINAFSSTKPYSTQLSVSMY